MNARGGEEEAAAAAPPASRYTLLNDVVVDWERGCVLRDGQVTALEPKAAAFLARLCATPGATLTREQAIRTVWNGTHVVDEAVMRIVSLLRAALGDDAKDPSFIETVPKRGYRLVAKTGAVSGPVPDARSGRRRTLAAAAALALLAFSAGWAANAWLLPDRPPPVRAINLDTGKVVELDAQ